MGKTTIPTSNEILHTYPAGTDLTGKEGLNVKLSSGKVVLCDTAGERPNGILVAGDVEGAQVTFQSRGVTKMVASANTIKIGNSVATTAAGKGAVATAGQFIFAQALEDANSDGHRILVEIINAGYVPAAG